MRKVPINTLHCNGEVHTENEAKANILNNLIHKLLHYGVTGKLLYYIG